MKFSKRVLTVLLTFIVLLSSNTMSFFTAFGAPNTEVRSVADKNEKESTKDTQSIKKVVTGDWGRAKKDGLVPPNRYFHEQVQRYIQNVKLSGSIVSLEQSVRYYPGKVPIDQKTDLGFIDVYQNDISNNIAYYWEVKPGSNILSLYDVFFQLRGYVNDTYILTNDNIKENRYGNLQYPDNKISKIKGKFSLRDLYNTFSEKEFDISEYEDIDISFDCILDDSKRYNILIAYLPCGIILYWFRRIPDKKLKNSIPVADPSVFYWLFGAQFLNVLMQAFKNNNWGNGPIDPPPAPAYEYDEATIRATFEEMSEYITLKAWKIFNDTFQESIIISDATIEGAQTQYYISENSIDSIQNKLLALGVISATSLLAAFATKDTSMSEFETIKSTISTCIQKIISNPSKYQKVLNGVCYYAISQSEYEAISNFTSIYNDIFTDEYLEVEIKTNETIKRTKNEPDTINNNIVGLGNRYEESQKQYQRDPLIINFSGTDDVEFTSLSDGVNFDLDNNEFAEKTAWIKNNDGFLAIDLNNNGKIDNGGELFGDSFIMSDGNCSKTGFEALSSLDTNGNGKIDADDAMFGNAKAYTDKGEKNLFDQLIVWFDNNHNGITDDGDELSSLNLLDVDYIDLNYTNDTYDADDNIPEEKGARQEGKSYVYFKDETTEKSISEFWFKVNNSTTIHDGEVTIGNVKNIEQAIADDETSTLYGLCLAFNYSTDIAEKRCLLKKILYFITDSSDIEIGSRGGNIDARDLHVVEAFMGHEFIGVDGRNPNAPAAEMLKDIYRSIEDRYYCIINLKMSFGGYMTVTFDDKDVNGDKYLNIELLNVVIDEMAKENDPEADILIYDLGVYLKIYDNIHGTKCFDSYKEHYLAKSPKYQEIVELIGNSYTYIDTEGDDTYSGSVYNDFVFGESGNNELNGSSGNDRIYSGFGDDLLQGGEGDDRYYFGIYHGNDVVKDTNGNNQIIFIDGYSIDDYDISFTLDGKFVLINKYTEDSITLNDFIAYPGNYEFVSNNENSTIGGGEAREIIEGTDDDDELDASDGFNVFYGKNGNDTIDGGMDIDFMYGGNGDDILLGRNGINAMFGESGNDIIYDGDDSGYLNGGDGEDMLYGGGSTDILDGGAGNDYLQGDHGNDTYIFGKGYDIDTIAASSDLHTIIIHNYSVNDMHNTREMNNDLVIDLGNETGDRIIVKAFFDFNANRDYCFIFDDDTVLGQYDITAKSAPIYGTEEDDYLRGTDEIDTLDGGAGDDNLCGNNGEDTYIFGKDYAHDIINEWGDDHSFVEFKDINSNEITVSNQWESNLIISVNDTEDILTISNFKWGQASYTFKFADGAEGYVDKNTWELVLTKQPDPIEEDISENTTVLSDSDIETNIVNETIIESENAIEQDSDAEIEETSDIDNDLVA